MRAALKLRKIDASNAVTAHLPEQKQNSQQKAEVADPIDNEGLVSGYRIGVVLVPESDQEV